MSPVRIVLDTNLLVSYLLTQGETTSQIVEYWRQRRVVVLMSPAIVAELQDVLTRARLKKLMTVDPRRIMRLVETDVIHTAGDVEALGACRDWKDEKFLACAVEGQADFIVTGDKDLLELRSYRGVPIIRAHELVAIIRMMEQEEH